MEQGQSEQIGSVRRKALVGAGVAGVLGVPLGATPAAASSAAPRVAQTTVAAGNVVLPDEPIAAQRTTNEVDCTNPPDARDVYRFDIVRIGDGLDLGDVILRYSPICRKVQAVGLTNDQIPVCQANLDFCVRAFVFHDGRPTAYNRANTGTRKTSTNWVGDADIQQLAYASIMVGDTLLAHGDTPPY